MSILIKGYVEREQALDVINLADFIADERGLLLYADSVQAYLLDIPTADVQPVVRGEWIWDDEGYHCSECFFHAYGNTGEILGGEYHFCSNCGARMDVE